MAKKGTYTYLSWIRKGMASEIQEVDQLGGSVAEAYDNASVAININVKSGTEQLGSGNRDFALLGPGDITVKAIASSEAHTEPIRGLRNVEYNYLPYIQFYDEDFPWRFSPAKDKSGKLRPWLQLIALTEDEFSSSGINSKNYAQIQINADVPMPNHSEAYLWSHVQIDHSLADYGKSMSKAEAIQDIMKNEPNAITSRILCPRKLEPNTHYYVFLIPAFERGRLAGLGHDISSAGVQDYAIQETVTSQKYDFPTYYSWDFYTSDGGGDFEELSRKLKKVESDELETDERAIGSKSFSALDIGDGLHYTGTAFGAEGEMNLFGALTQPSANPESIIRLEDEEVKEFASNLTNYLNAPLNNFKGAPNSFSEELDNLEDDPIISAPMYGSWHSQSFAVDHLKNEDWQNEINLDPGNRIVAGLGAELFRENQDEMMQTAWEQYGEIREANRKINQAAFLEMTNKKLFDKYFKHSTSERLIGTTSLLHGRIKFGSESVKSHLEAASIPSGSFTKAFQNSTSNGSDFMKSLITRNAGVTKGEMSTEVFKSKAALPKSIQLSESSMIVSQSSLSASIDSTLKSTTKLRSFKIAPDANLSVKRREQTAVKSALRSLKAQIGGNTGVQAQMAAPSVQFGALKTSISKAILPQTTLLSKLNGVINLPKGMIKKLNPVMAYPKINIPIHSLILEKHLELFIPQLDLLPDNSVTILSANQQYIESIMLGFNSEMARELVWRDYPTDQRGSYARIFWDSIKMKNDTDLSLEETANKYGHIEEIHNWSKSHGNNPNPINDLSDMIVVVLRGELLQKFPNTLIYFQKAKWNKTKSKRIMNGSASPLLPEFSAKLTSDIHILGFDISAEEARGATDKLGSFLVLQEPPAENKFGLDIFSDDYDSWNDIAWNQFKDSTEYIQISDLEKTNKTFDGVTWGANSNHMAYILNQRPFKFGIHAEKLI